MTEESYCEDHHKLWEAVEQFIKENEITCAETIGQCDWVAENSPDFLEKLCDIVGYHVHVEAPAGVEPALRGVKVRCVTAPPRGCWSGQGDLNPYRPA